MIRKQLYLDLESERKLKRLAHHWRCTEAAVVRKAMAGLSDGARSPDQEAYDRLVAMGVITPPPGPPLTDEEDEAMMRELDEIWAKHPDTPSLSQYVIEDREGR